MAAADALVVSQHEEDDGVSIVNLLCTSAPLEVSCFSLLAYLAATVGDVSVCLATHLGLQRS